MSTAKNPKITLSCNISVYLNRALSRSGMNQIKLSKLTGLRPASISEFSNGIKNPSFENIVKIADAFGFTLDQFFSVGQHSEPEKYDGLTAKEWHDKYIDEALDHKETLKELREMMKEHEKGLQSNVSSDTDATETALNAKIPAGSNITESNSTTK